MDTKVTEIKTIYGEFVTKSVSLSAPTIEAIDELVGQDAVGKQIHLQSGDSANTNFALTVRYSSIFYPENAEDPAFLFAGNTLDNDILFGMASIFTDIVASRKVFPNDGEEVSPFSAKFFKAYKYILKDVLEDRQSIDLVIDAEGDTKEYQFRVDYIYSSGNKKIVFGADVRMLNNVKVPIILFITAEETVCLLPSGKVYD